MVGTRYRLRRTKLTNFRSLRAGRHLFFSFLFDRRTESKFGLGTRWNGEAVGSVVDAFVGNAYDSSVRRHYYLSHIYFNLNVIRLEFGFSRVFIFVPWDLLWYRKTFHNIANENSSICLREDVFNCFKTHIFTYLKSWRSSVHTTYIHCTNFVRKKQFTKHCRYFFLVISQ